MPRFFFNLRRNHLTLCDPCGEECSRPIDALEHAFVAALALMSERGFFRTWTGWAVDVEDEARSRVATIPFVLAMRTEPASPIGSLDRPLQVGAH